MDNKEITRREFLTWFAAGAAMVMLPGGIAKAAAPSWAFADLDLPLVDVALESLVIPDPPPPIINPPGVSTPVAPAAAKSPARGIRLSARSATSAPTAPAASASAPVQEMAAPSSTAAPYNHGAYAQFNPYAQYGGYDYQTMPTAYQHQMMAAQAQAAAQPTAAAQAQAQRISSPKLSAARSPSSAATSEPAIPMAVASPASGGKVTALSRRMWANVAANPEKMRPMGQVKKITIHHEGSEKPNNDVMPFDVVETLRIIHGQHRRRMGAGDIGYHFIIDRTGLIWQGRDWSFQGAHTSGANTNNLGVMLLGNFEMQRPTQPQLDSLHRLVASLVRKFGLNAARDIYGHGDFCKTQCPGTNLRPQVEVLRRMSM